MKLNNWGQNKFAGRKINSLRKFHKHSQEELSKKLNLSLSAFGKLERGEREIPLDLIKKIAEMYKVDLAYFFKEYLEDQHESHPIFNKEWIDFIDRAEYLGLSPKRIEKILDLVVEFSKDVNRNSSFSKNVES